VNDRATIQCERCGATMPAPREAEAPAQCLRCLLGVGLDDVGAEGAAESRPEHFVTHDGGAFETPSPEDLAPFFPQLEIESVLGQGGMGVVYLARHRTLDRKVALKVISERVAGRPDFARRFEREARTLARLTHPNIVTVFDSGRAAGLCYLVMEHVDGVDLRRVLASDEKLSSERALALVRQICAALEYAHAEGVVHRDIKPENILIDRAGRVKIADFGLAKLAGDGLEATLTRSGPMGTLHYMAPEQVERPHAVDHRADIYSLGVVFYELLTGELPLGRFDPPSERARVDARLDDVVMKALAKEPARRYQRASDVATDVDGLGDPARSEREPRRARPAPEPETTRAGWNPFRRRGGGQHVAGTGVTGGQRPIPIWMYGLGLALVTLGFHLGDLSDIPRVGFQPALLQVPVVPGGVVAGVLLALAVQRGRAVRARRRGPRLLFGLALLAVPFVYGSGLLHEVLEELLPVDLYSPGDPTRAPATTRGFGFALGIWSVLFLGSHFAYGTHAAHAAHADRRARRTPGSPRVIGAVVLVASVVFLLGIVFLALSPSGLEPAPTAAVPAPGGAGPFGAWDFDPFAADRWGAPELGLLIAAIAIVGYRTDRGRGRDGEFDLAAFKGLGGVYVAVFVLVVAFTDWQVHQLAMLIALGGMMFHGGRGKRRRRGRS